MSVEPNKTSPVVKDAEPREGWAPAPVLLIGLLALLAFLGMTHLADHAGGFDRVVYEPYISSNQVDSLQYHDPKEELRRMGAQVFVQCAACHQASGLGLPPSGFPPLAGSDWVNAEGPNRVIRIVLNGLSGPLVVNGKSFGQATMVPWRDTLTDTQIAGVVNFIRQNKEWGNSASDVTPQQVKAIRDKTADKGGPWSAADLLKVPDKD